MAYLTFDNRKVFYSIRGDGEPLLLLHGNTASSKMFAFIVAKYAKKFKTIIIDFPGHGKSDRLEKFPVDFWFYNSEVCYALIEKLDLNHVNVVGTSGGALVALNLGLEHPEKIKTIIADSFEGEYPLSSFVDTLSADRETDKKKLLAQLFWRFNHGKDWRNVVDSDTSMNMAFAKSGKSFFHKSIDELKVPTLLTGSLQDEYCCHLDKIYERLQKNNNLLKVQLFKQGNHPAMLSNKNEFFEIIEKLITT